MVFIIAEELNKTLLLIPFSLQIKPDIFGFFKLQTILIMKYF